MNHPGDQEVERAREWVNAQDKLFWDYDPEAGYSRRNFPQMLAAYASSRDAERLAKAKELAKVVFRSQEYLELRWAGIGLKQADKWDGASLDVLRIEFNKALIARDASQKSLVAELVGALENLLGIRANIFAALSSHEYKAFCKCGGCHLHRVLDGASELLARAKETM